MRWNIVCGGPAGFGPNFLANLISTGLVKKGFYVFTSREYESRIRGGHNYNLISFSNKPIFSNSDGIDLLVALDELSIKTHQKELNKKAFVIKDSKNNVFAAGQAFKILGIDFHFIDEELKKLSNYEKDIKDAKAGYDSEKREFKHPNLYYHDKIKLINGNDAVALGSFKSGLEFYYAYPMTPATGVLFSLVKNEKNSNFTTIQLESEIAVINAAIGSAITGSKSMVGTSGGGFDLMSESLSLAGGAHVPLVIYLAQRPGPATGAATYTAQADLNLALHAGHGEFNRVVVAPGDPKEASEKVSELFLLSQKYRLPAILLSDKHLADSYYSLSGEPNLVKSTKTIKWPSRFTSYEADERIVANSSPESINNSVKKMKDKYQKLSMEIDKFETFKIHGNTKSKNLIIGWGSTKGAILDSIEGLNCKYLQIIYLEPFSKKIIAELKKSNNLIIIENNSTSQLSSLLAEKAGIFIEEKNKILKYDGRPFMFNSLQKEIKKRLK